MALILESTEGTPFSNCFLNSSGVKLNAVITLSSGEWFINGLIFTLFVRSSRWAFELFSK